MRSFYIKHVLHPLFMFQIRHLPLFFDFCYLYVMDIQRQVHGVMLKPDWIERAREQLAARE